MSSADGGASESEPLLQENENAIALARLARPNGREQTTVNDGQNPPTSNGQGQGSAIPNGQRQSPSTPNSQGQSPATLNVPGQGLPSYNVPGQSHSTSNGQRQDPSTPNGHEQDPPTPNAQGQSPPTPNAQGQGPSTSNVPGQGPSTSNVPGQGPSTSNTQGNKGLTESVKAELLKIVTAKDLDKLKAMLIPRDDHMATGDHSSSLAQDRANAVQQVVESKTDPPIHWMVERCWREGVEHLLSYSPKAIRQINGNKQSVLHVAVKKPKTKDVMSGGRAETIEGIFNKQSMPHVAVKKTKNKEVTSSGRTEKNGDVNQEVKNDERLEMLIMLLARAKESDEEPLDTTASRNKDKATNKEPPKRIINFRDSEGSVPLHLVTIARNKGMLSTILEALAEGDQERDVNVRDTTGMTPLHHAVNKYWIEGVDLLIAANADVAAIVNPDSRKPGKKAINKGKTCLHLAATCNYKPTNLMTPKILYYARKQKKVHKIINAVDDDGNTPIFMAIFKSNKFETIKLLLDAGADVSHVVDSRNILHCAAECDQPDVIEKLFQHDKSKSDIRKLINDKTKGNTREGYTALHISASKGHAKCAEVLLAQGADITLLTTLKMESSAQTSTSEVQGTALHLAVANGKADVVKVITDYLRKQEQKDADLLCEKHVIVNKLQDIVAGIDAENLLASDPKWRVKINRSDEKVVRANDSKLDNDISKFDKKALDKAKARLVERSSFCGNELKQNSAWMKLSKQLSSDNIAQDLCELELNMLRDKSGVRDTALHDGVTQLKDIERMSTTENNISAVHKLLDNKHDLTRTRVEKHITDWEKDADVSSRNLPKKLRQLSYGERLKQLSKPVDQSELFTLLNSYYKLARIQIGKRIDDNAQQLKELVAGSELAIDLNKYLFAIKTDTSDLSKDQAKLQLSNALESKIANKLASSKLPQDIPKEGTELFQTLTADLVKDKKLKEINHDFELIEKFHRLIRGRETQLKSKVCVLVDETLKVSGTENLSQLHKIKTIHQSDVLQKVLGNLTTLEDVQNEEDVWRTKVTDALKVSSEMKNMTNGLSISRLVLDDSIHKDHKFEGTRVSGLKKQLKKTLNEIAINLQKFWPHHFTVEDIEGLVQPQDLDNIVTEHEYYTRKMAVDLILKLEGFDTFEGRKDKTAKQEKLASSLGQRLFAVISEKLCFTIQLEDIAAQPGLDSEGHVYQLLNEIVNVNKVETVRLSVSQLKLNKIKAQFFNKAWVDFKTDFPEYLTEIPNEVLPLVLSMEIIAPSECLRSGLIRNFLNEYTALEAMYQKNKIEVEENKKILLEINNKPDDRSYTPLQIACIYRQSEPIPILAKSGADFSAKCSLEDNKERTAMDLFICRVPGSVEILEEIFNGTIQMKNQYCQIDYRVLSPNTNERKPHTMRIVDSLLQTGDKFGQLKLFEHPLVTSFLSLQWREIRPTYIIFAGVYCLFLLFLTCLVINGYIAINDYQIIDTVFKFFTGVCLPILFCFEVLFVLANRWKQNWFELVMKVLCYILTMVLICWPPNGCPRHVAASAILLAYIEVMLIISRFPEWGFNTLLFLEGATNYIKFLFSFVPLIFGFTIAFNITFRNLDSFQYTKALAKMGAMMNSEFELKDMVVILEDEKNMFSLFFAQFVLLLFIFLVGNVLTNLLIAKAVNESPKVRRLKHQAGFISKQESMLKLLDMFLKIVLQKTFISKQESMRTLLGTRSKIVLKMHIVVNEIKKQENLFDHKVINSILEQGEKNKAAYRDKNDKQKGETKDGALLKMINETNETVLKIAQFLHQNVPKKKQEEQEGVSRQA